MRRKKRTRKQLGHLESPDAHLMEYCNWCEECKPSFVAHYPVVIRSNQGIDRYWVCFLCLEECYKNTQEKLPHVGTPNAEGAFFVTPFPPKEEKEYEEAEEETEEGT